MNEDVERHTNQAIECISAWNQYRKSILSGANSGDIQELVNSGINSYSFVYSARYWQWNIKRYTTYPAQYSVDGSHILSMKKLYSELQTIESESGSVWELASGKIKSSLPRTEWKKYLKHLDDTSGSSKYAVNLGPI